MPATRLCMIALALALAACGGEKLEMDKATEESAPQAADLSGGAASRQAIAPISPAPPPTRSMPQTPGQASDSLPASMIIRTGTAQVEVEDLEPAVDSVRALIARLEGQIVDFSLQIGAAQRREARIVARIPSPRFDGAVAGLAPVGKVEAVNVSAQDVGEEYVDLQAQVTNRRRLEARLLQLLDTRTGRLEDVLAVERELARVREEIDRQEGRLRYLRNQVAMSTLTVMLHEPAPLVSAYQGQNVFLDALRTAWRNLIGFIVAVIGSLGVLIPLALLAWVAWLVLRRIRRRRAAGQQ